MQVQYGRFTNALSAAILGKAKGVVQYLMEKGNAYVNVQFRIGSCIKYGSALALVASDEALSNELENLVYQTNAEVDARHLSGSSANLLIPNTNFRVTSGFPKTYSMTHESGMKLTTHFCENCGSLLYKVGDREEFKGAVIVLAGTLDDEEEFEKAKPEAEFFVKHRVGWWPELGDAMQLGEFS
ncbi:hypothetical protein ETB97_006218 [Aspergillus alliaceus]|uniref:CENP-V/GFA domain-containing protein n=1 Tax=Petromyces alliaceus TaxID=209559 RepID=A0A8H5ZUM4_PETAA|nr:hypothetical protein ETB97_006218 [Aspergillus burnettii]